MRILSLRIDRAEVRGGRLAFRKAAEVPSGGGDEEEEDPGESGKREPDWRPRPMGNVVADETGW